MDLLDLMPQHGRASMEEQKQQEPTKDMPGISMVIAIIFGVVVLAGWWSKKSEADRITITCHEDIRQKAKYPSKAVFSSTVITQGREGTREVRGTAEFMNGYGAMIPRTYRCSMTSSGTVASSSTEEER